MLVFLDFEASSLNKLGYPIEVGWVFEDGREEAHLIRPAPAWSDWHEEAEAVHGISRAMLAGAEPHDAVAARLVAELSGHDIRASSPSWDGKWLSVLLRGGGFPRHLLRLRDTDEALLEAAGGRAELVAQARTEAEAVPVAHRALADARRERDVWLRVRELRG